MKNVRVVCKHCYVFSPFLCWYCWFIHVCILTLKKMSAQQAQ